MSRHERSLAERMAQRVAWDIPRNGSHDGRNEVDQRIMVGLGLAVYLLLDL